MRLITQKVWSHVSLTSGEKMYVREVRTSPPHQVETFSELVEAVAHVSYRNPDHALFFRGQARDHQTAAEGSTIMPSLYRLGTVGRHSKQSVRTVQERFRVLQLAEEQLIDGFSGVAPTGVSKLRQFGEVCWAILQHYEVTPTPLLDLTTSLRVAASFATSSGSRSGVLMVLGMPHPHGSISYYVEQQLSNLRLLSICPPSVVRPYYQEGYAAGTFPTRETWVRSSNHDFARRLIAKFSLPRTLWDASFPAIPQEALYPNNDAMLQLTSQIQSSLRNA